MGSDPTVAGANPVAPTIENTATVPQSLAPDELQDIRCSRIEYERTHSENALPPVKLEGKA